uniref:Small ribosomal subunit protein mS40 n=1 Tax=Strongyloides venezuelensis TaxID=75913 RepID=A0A0K0FKK1_STRVS
MYLSRRIINGVVSKNIYLTTSVRNCSNEKKFEETSKWAYNYIQMKKRLYKPKHTIDEQIRYMKSETYNNTYKGLPIYKWYKRNVKGQESMQSKPRLFCIDKEGKFNVNNACPVCRDEYLFFDYRNPSLIEQFLLFGTDKVLPILKTGLCIEQYNQLKAQLLKAKEHGTITFAIAFRNFDYKQWYPNLDVSHLPENYISGSVRDLSINDIHPEPLVNFPVHKKDLNTDWDEWWIRYDKFARKAK